MLVTEAGMVREVSDVQPMKMPELRLDTVPGMTTPVMAVLLPKALELMPLTVMPSTWLGMTTSVSVPK